MTTMFLRLACFALLTSCAHLNVPPADRPVALARGRYGPLFVRFPDGTVGSLRSWSNGTQELRWRSTWRAKDFVADDNRVCVLTVDDDAFCVDADSGSIAEQRLHEPGALDVGLSVDHELCVVTSQGQVRCVEGFGAQKHRGDVLFAKFPRVARLVDFTPCAIDHDARLVCRGDQLAGKYWDDVVTPLLSDVRDASLVPNGPAVTGCAVLRSGRLSCFGNNRFGEQGTGRRSGGEPLHEVPGLPPIHKVAHTSGVTCALDGEGNAWCFGAWFGPDYERAARDTPRCPRHTRQVVVPACPESGANGDNPCLRMGGSPFERTAEEVVVERDAAGQCSADQSEDYVPTPTRITLFSRARDVVVRHEGVFFVTDDGELISTFYGKAERAVLSPPREPTRKQ